MPRVPASRLTRSGSPSPSAASSGPLRRLHSARLCPGPHSASAHSPIPPPTAPLRCIQPCTWLLGRLRCALPPPAHTLRLRREPPPHVQYAPQPFPIAHGGYVQYPLPGTILSTPMAPSLPVMHTDDAAMKLSDRIYNKVHALASASRAVPPQTQSSCFFSAGARPAASPLVASLVSYHVASTRFKESPFTFK
ncbi:hypothetical protein B0H13DRAFT_2689532 [Mycena leptocephala]|nr:hypothetical protein B0H13DRAFT_2689532 [Mycena leptocephala]